MEHPMVACTFEAVCDHADNAFLLRYRASGLRLKGQMVHYTLPAPAAAASTGSCRLAHRSQSPGHVERGRPMCPHPLPEGLDCVGATCPMIQRRVDPVMACPRARAGAGPDGAYSDGGGDVDFGSAAAEEGVQNAEEDVLLLMCSPLVTGLDEMLRQVLSDAAAGQGYPQGHTVSL